MTQCAIKVTEGEEEEGERGMMRQERREGKTKEEGVGCP